MKQKDLEIAGRFKEMLSHVVDLTDYRIFGSRARGDEDEYSDLDLFVEVASIDKEIKEKILDLSWELSLENCMVISPLIFTKDEIDNSPLRSSFIVRNILEEGIKI